MVDHLYIFYAILGFDSKQCMMWTKKTSQNNFYIAQSRRFSLSIFFATIYLTQTASTAFNWALSEHPKKNVEPIRPYIALIIRTMYARLCLCACVRKRLMSTLFTRRRSSSLVYIDFMYTDVYYMNVACCRTFFSLLLLLHTLIPMYIYVHIGTYSNGVYT